MFGKWFKSEPTRVDVGHTIVEFRWRTPENAGTERVEFKGSAWGGGVEIHASARARHFIDGRDPVQVRLNKKGHAPTFVPRDRVFEYTIVHNGPFLITI